ncbi:probable WRKY transcription factor 54 [Lolium rigidum]|uniref:probable WRKY transcription factor 54 n=1 Tax=Lolium rigidum TaxID=89674 RepID=UPI001F5CAF90|nr:probable WRKY transcription factor 54 [Lolium rigidum]
MQAPGIVNADGSAATGFGSAAADEQFYEAVVRELTRGKELTAQLQAEVLRALRGQRHAEAAAAFILQEVSRAFTFCISIMDGSAPAPAAAPSHATVATAAAVGARRARDDGAPRKSIMTPSPNSDGYEWRKYGQKRIMGTSFPRCYFRCCYHRERSCPATKQVQEQHSNGGPRMYLVIYVHEHTCHRTSPAVAEPEATTGSPTEMLDFSAAAGFSRQQPGGVVQLSKEELEQQVLVSSLTCVLQGRQLYPGGGSPEEWSSQGRPRQDGAPVPAVSIETSAELPASLGDDDGLDVMDYDVSDTMYFGASSSYSYGGDHELLL